ncbi:MAG: hypothetical protein J7530_01440 [Novosphingobium sp.]|nr:hypothetical protein [Novosphingobium sp.]
MLRLLSVCSAGILLLVAAGAEGHIVGPPAPRPSSPPYRDIQQKAEAERYRLDLRNVDRAIREGRESGRLSKQDSKRLRKERQQIDSLAKRYGSDGLSPREAQELYMRERVLESQARLPGNGKR